MEFRRPAPLSDDIEAPPAAIASGRGPMLLGRLHSPLVKHTSMKPSSIRTPSGLFNAFTTPLASVTSNAPFRFPFTPMATPSPSGRMIMPTFTPGALPRGMRSITAAAAPAAAGGNWADWSAAVAEEAHAEAGDDDDAASCSDGDGVAVQAGPPPPPGAAHPSLGSAGHASGACKRCCFFPRNRCNNGYECPFCHYEHEKPKRKHRSRRGGKTGAEPAAVVGMPMAMQAVPAPMLQRPMMQYPGGLCCLVQPLGMAMPIPYNMRMPPAHPPVIALEPAVMPARAI